MALKGSEHSGGCAGRSCSGIEEMRCDERFSNDRATLMWGRSRQWKQSRQENHIHKFNVPKSLPVVFILKSDTLDILRSKKQVKRNVASY